MLYSFFENLVPKKICVKQRCDGQFIIAMNAKNELHYLNDTAAFIFEKIDGKTSINEILNAVYGEYEIMENDKSRVIEDMISIIRDFQWQNLIKLTEVHEDEKIH